MARVSDGSSPIEALVAESNNDKRTIAALVAALEACRGAMSEESPTWDVSNQEYDEIKVQADAALELARKGG